MSKKKDKKMSDETQPNGVSEFDAPDLPREEYVAPTPEKVKAEPSFSISELVALNKHDETLFGVPNHVLKGALTNANMPLSGTATKTEVVEAIRNFEKAPAF